MTTRCFKDDWATEQKQAAFTSASHESSTRKGLFFYEARSKSTQAAVWVKSPCGELPGKLDRALAPCISHRARMNKIAPKIQAAAIASIRLVTTKIRTATTTSFYCHKIPRIDKQRYCKICGTLTIYARIGQPEVKISIYKYLPHRNCQGFSGDFRIQ